MADNNNATRHSCSNRSVNTPTRISQICRLRRSCSVTASPTRSLDRFIPSRRDSDFESAYYKLMSPAETACSDGAYSPQCSGSPASYRCSATREDNILTFSPVGKTSSKGRMRSLERMYNELSLNTPKKAKNKRYIPKSPDRVLDMPDIRDDFYTNVLDWSCTNNIAVALGNLVYSWNSDSGKCHLVPLNPEDSSTLVCSLAWAPNGSHLALGLENGHILLWDVDKDQLLQLKSRHTCTHGGGVDVLAWAPDESALYSGQNCGCVQQIDQRTGMMSFIKFGHTGGVCGLKVSQDGHYLASGGTDHQLHVWNIRQKSTHQQIQAHNASIKALAWCPWQSTVLATGGGLGDGYIRIWNINSGSKLAEVNTHSQICCMLWSSRHREIVTGHGCERHDVTLWSYPQLRPVATLSAHDGRVLFLAISPDGKTVGAFVWCRRNADAVEMFRLGSSNLLPTHDIPVMQFTIDTDNSLSKKHVK